MVELQYEDKIIKVEEGTKIIDIFKDEIVEKEALAIYFNNEIQTLDYEVRNNGKVRLITFEDAEGKRTYNRGIIYILTKALNELYPEALLTVDYHITGSMFCDIENMEITNEFIEKINSKMREITQKDLKINKVTMTHEEAVKFYEKENTLRGIKQIDIEGNDQIFLYYCEDFYNYMYGVLPISTGEIKTYNVSKYKNGFLVSFPDKKDKNKLFQHIDSDKLFHALDEYDNICKELEVNTLYRLNKKIENDQIKEQILLAEALHDKKIAEIAADIAKRKDVKIILIAGPSSSGKTTFASKLSSHLKINGLKPLKISVDNYFVERDETPLDENGQYNFEAFEAIDLQLFNDHLNKLLNGEEVEMPEFDFAEGHKNYLGNRVKLADDEVMVIEGIHCLNDELTRDVPRENKYKIYISALTVLNVDYHNRISTTDTRLIRRIVRDYQYRSYTALHTLQMWNSVKRGESKNIFPYQETVDAMFNSSLVYELNVLRQKAIPLLKAISRDNIEYSEAQRLIYLLSMFEPIPLDYIPSTSLLREFMGGSIYYG